MAEPRFGHAATLLKDGRVLITGGYTRAIGEAGWCPTRGIEIFAPAEGRFHAAGSLVAPRANHQAVLLHDGRVLIVGGSKEGWNSVSIAEIYYPATGDSRHLGSTLDHYDRMSAVLMEDGDVLIAGTRLMFDPDHRRLGGFSAEIFHPTKAGGTFERLGPPSIGAGPLFPLPGGRILHQDAAGHLETYDPGSRAFTSLGRREWAEGRMLAMANGDLVSLQGAGMDTAYRTPRATLKATFLRAFQELLPDATVLALQDGRILALGGAWNSLEPAQADTWLLDPRTGESQRGNSMHQARIEATTCLLKDGSVLVSGGRTSSCGSTALSRAEVFVAR
ncbi:MAG: hypothetical protein IPL96_11170 [Holophagaceae bacterium]|nr:hypothetical protein [Holophagaceae bacterium]